MSSESSYPAKIKCDSQLESRGIFIGRHDFRALQCKESEFAVIGDRPVVGNEAVKSGIKVREGASETQNELIQDGRDDVRGL